ncbi:MAG: peptide chain release factor N(5)-glutamine methyltransferase [Deltaproteobacteria bacterium]|nr:MAG: peptide chain release factor N(5)-glutamine methyltransferase [Deltaproteobacteria bacterium]
MTGAVLEAATTVGSALAAAVARLAAAGVPEPRADAEVLLAHALGTSRAGVIARSGEPLPAGAAARLEPLVARRVAREPLHYLLGEREFWSLPFAVDRRVLIPRPETELVVETALSVAPAARRVLDLGTGSGAIAAALARALPNAQVSASDVDQSALTIARANLARHAPRVACIAGDVVGAFGAGTFDLVVSNPPYVAEAELTGLEPEVREHEPRRALAGGADGLATVRRLVCEVPRVLTAGGWLVMEVGAGQAAAVAALAAADGRWRGARRMRDHGGVERVVALARRGDAWTRS